MSLQQNTPPPDPRRRAAAVSGTEGAQAYRDGSAPRSVVPTPSTPVFESPSTEVRVQPDRRAGRFTWGTVLAGLAFLTGAGALITAFTVGLALVYVGRANLVDSWIALGGAGVVVTVGTARWLARH